MKSIAPPLILHVVHRFDVGGLENGVVNLINRMSHQDWRHAILSLTEISEGFAKRVKRDDVQYISLRKGPGHLLNWYPKLHRLFKGLAPAIVHTRNLAALEASVPAWTSGIPARVHGEHGWDVTDPYGQVRRYQYVRRAYRPFVHRYIALSQQIQAYLEQCIGIRSESISQIYNGVDTSKFQIEHGSQRQANDCPFSHPEYWVVGSVGRLEQVKDQLNLARAFVRALEMNPAAKRRMRLAVIGDGTMRERVMDVVTRAGLASYAWFPGSRTDIPQVLGNLDCFVLPSLSEGISNTILEAMASGLPIVATRVGGNAELIEDGLSGLLVPPGNSEAMARAILSYFLDPGVARRHGRTARRVVEDRFSLDRMVSEYTAMYESLLQRAGGRDRFKRAMVA